MVIILNRINIIRLSVVFINLIFFIPLLWFGVIKIPYELDLYVEYNEFIESLIYISGSCWLLISSIIMIKKKYLTIVPIVISSIVWINLFCLSLIDYIYLIKHHDDFQITCINYELAYTSLKYTLPFFIVSNIMIFVLIKSFKYTAENINHIIKNKTILIFLITYLLIVLFQFFFYIFHPYFIKN
jgi:hypothetical protein